MDNIDLIILKAEVEKLNIKLDYIIEIIRLYKK